MSEKVYKLFGERALVEIYKTPTVIGSLVLPSQKDTQQAKVRFVSEEMGDILQLGDDILLDLHEGTKVNGFLLVEKKGILAKIER